MAIITTTTYQSPVGELVLGALDGRLCLCDWRYRKMRQAVDQRIQTHLDASYAPGNDAVLDEAQTQLEAYFAGRRTELSVPILFAGTEFQQLVWKFLMQIPFGETRSYGELAKSMGKPRSVRAVASANGANALSIFVPCHRIIGSDGALVGYAGGLRAKEKLLRLETRDLFSEAGLLV